MRAAAVALALSLSLVGGCTEDSDDPPSVEEFCAGYAAYVDALFATSGSGEGYVEELKAAARDLEHVGTPDDMPRDARRALAAFLDAVLALPDDATQQDLADINRRLSEEQKQDAAALLAYLADTCPEAAGL